MARKQDEYEQQGLATREEHERILRALHAQAEEARASLEITRQERQEQQLELGTLRGRLAHASKEQAQWEQDLRERERTETEEIMGRLRELRSKDPKAAASAAERMASAAERMAAAAAVRPALLE